MDSERPVFVVGMARSGTTLIGTMIGAHPELTIAPETHFLDLCVQAEGYEGILDTDDMVRIWRAYASEERFRVLGLDAAAIERRLVEANVHEFATAYRILLEAYAEKLGRKGWGDKTHLDHEFVEWLFASYPEARVVCVIRDPRATVASLLKAPWSSGKAFYYALQWRDTMRIVESLEGRDRMLIVRYEDAVSRPEEALARICAFLGVDAAPEMMAREGDPAPVAKDDGWALGEWWAEHKEKALGPVTTESLDRWRSELSAYEVAAIERICRVGMKSWGYAPVTTELAPAYAVRLFAERAGRVLRALLRPIRTLHHRKSIFRPRP